MRVSGRATHMVDSLDEGVRVCKCVRVCVCVCESVKGRTGVSVTCDPNVLWLGGPKGDLLDAAASEQLCRAIEACWTVIYARFVQQEGSAVDYDTGLLQSSPYAPWRTLVVKLELLDIATLAPDTRLALFLNLYNMLTIEAVVSRKHRPASVLDVPRFWKTYAYRIGRHTYTLDDLEHGLLRGTLSPHTHTHARAHTHTRVRIL